MMLSKKLMFGAIGAVGVATLPVAAHATFGWFSWFAPQPVHAPQPAVVAAKPQPYSYSSKGYGGKNWGRTPCCGSDACCSGSSGGGSSSGGSDGGDAGPTPVPEPGMFGLIGIGLAALAGRRLRRRRGTPVA